MTFIAQPAGRNALIQRRTEEGIVDLSGMHRHPSTSLSWNATTGAQSFSQSANDSAFTLDVWTTIATVTGRGFLSRMAYTIAHTANNAGYTIALEIDGRVVLLETNAISSGSYTTSNPGVIFGHAVQGDLNLLTIVPATPGAFFKRYFKVLFYADYYTTSLGFGVYWDHVFTKRANV